MRCDALRIVAVALFVLISCEEAADDAPLRGTAKGLSALRWGDGPDLVRQHMLDLPEVDLVRDTVEIHAFAAWMTPDTVLASLNVPHYRFMEFRGGAFLGHAVARWRATLDAQTSFRRLEVVLRPMDDAGGTMWKLRRQLRGLYGRPNEPEFEADRFFADDWSRAASSASKARMAIGMSRIGPQITVEFADRVWEDSLWTKRKRSRSRMHVDEWRRRLADHAKTQGWNMEALPPQ